MSKLHEYKGAGVTVSYDKHRCIHAAECATGLPAVFDPQARPWVNPDGAEASAVVEVVRRCPTGALQAVWEGGDTSRPSGTQGATTVEVSPDGPLHARGDMVVLDAAGEEILRDTRVAFCRCGASRNKPFCDGRHAEVGFQDPGAITDPKLGKGADSGPLRVTPAKNGPLLLDGPVELCAAGGVAPTAGSRAALCRCGASANKPFCDGSHAAAGFEG